MSTTTYQNEKDVTITMKEYKGILKQWELRVDRLEEELKHFKRETQLKYEDQVEEMREKLHEAQVRLQAMIEGDPKEWAMGQPEFEEKFETFKAAFMRTANAVKHEDEAKEVTLGWLQGFSEERTVDSAGWAEGMGEPAESSEGWVEGMGEQEQDSEGWVEGYERR